MKRNIGWIGNFLGSGSMVMVENGFRELDRVLRMNKTKKRNQPPSQRENKAVMGVCKVFRVIYPSSNFIYFAYTYFKKPFFWKETHALHFQKLSSDFKAILRGCTLRETCEVSIDQSIYKKRLKRSWRNLMLFSYSTIEDIFLQLTKELLRWQVTVYESGCVIFISS